MKNNRSKRSSQGFGLIEMLLALVIILFFCYKVLNLYFKQSSLDKEASENLSAQGVDTSNYKAIINSAKEKVAAFNLKIEGQNQDFENIK